MFCGAMFMANGSYVFDASHIIDGNELYFVYLGTYVLVVGVTWFPACCA